MALNSDVITYEDQVGIALLKMELEVLFVVVDKVKPDNYKAFFDAVKGYIDKNLGYKYGWHIEISSDYSSVRKVLIK
jgi:hypothetical protein